MKLEDKMKKYPTVKSDRCNECGNPWFWNKGDILECTTCGNVAQVKQVEV